MRRLDVLLMVVAAMVFTLATTAMTRGLEPFSTWYYSFAWWSYVTFADAALHLRSGRSVVLRNRGRARLLLFSVAIWLAFEVYNLRLGNWHYVALPPSRVERWAGYAVAFATVLPGLYVTAAWLEVLFPPRRGRPSSLQTIGTRVTRTCLWVGFVSSVLPWTAPRWFFPLVWLGPTLFLAALNYGNGEGILREIEAGGAGPLYRLLAAGAICGGLWELWNFWAGAKWVYDVPLFDRLRLFEMPLAGYLGFPPFAVECREMHIAGERWLGRTGGKAFVRTAVVTYYLAVFWAIDRFTVRSFAGF